MPRIDPQAPTLDEYGAETHPAFAMIGWSRVSSSVGGSLFDSDILHQHTIRITLSEATRKRELHRDFLHATQRTFEVEVSEAQWAAFVSTPNSGSGVPCSLRWTRAEGDTPGIPHSPRLAESIAETQNAAQRAFGGIQAAFRAYEAAGTAKEKREAKRTLQACIENAVPNVDFAGKTLAEHAENVVQKAKADVEAFVTAKAQQLGVEPGTMMLALPEGDS